MLPTARRAQHSLSKYESHGQWPRSHVWRNYVLDRQVFILNPSFARSGKLFLLHPHDVEAMENQRAAKTSLPASSPDVCHPWCCARPKRAGASFTGAASNRRVKPKGREF